MGQEDGSGEGLARIVGASGGVAWAAGLGDAALGERVDVGGGFGVVVGLHRDRTALYVGEDTPREEGTLVTPMGVPFEAALGVATLGRWVSPTGQAGGGGAGRSQPIDGAPLPGLRSSGEVLCSGIAALDTLAPAKAGSFVLAQGAALSYRQSLVRRMRDVTDEGRAVVVSSLTATLDVAPEPRLAVVGDRGPVRGRDRPLAVLTALALTRALAAEGRDAVLVLDDLDATLAALALWARVTHRLEGSRPELVRWLGQHAGARAPGPGSVTLVALTEAARQPEAQAFDRVWDLDDLGRPDTLLRDLGRQPLSGFARLAGIRARWQPGHAAEMARLLGELHAHRSRRAPLAPDRLARATRVLEWLIQGAARAWRPFDQLVAAHVLLSTERVHAGWSPVADVERWVAGVDRAAPELRTKVEASRRADQDTLREIADIVAGLDGAAAPSGPYR